MSLGIALTTSEGLVLSADSRQSYQNSKGVSRVGSDSAQKVFELNDRVGLVVAGLAFLNENDIPKNVSKYIEDFKRREPLNRLSVKEIADSLEKFFKTKHDHKQIIGQMKPQIEASLKSQGLEMIEHEQKDGAFLFRFKDKEGKVQQGMAMIPGLSFLVAGYNTDGSHMVCNVGIPGGVKVTRDSKTKGREYGADWIGQQDVVSRIVLGFDGRIQNLPFMQSVAQKNSPELISSQLRGLEYVIQWGAMTLQDGVDFSRLAIETTASIQRFSDGVAMDPGDMAGVGGAVDIAIIRPDPDEADDKQWQWLQKKELRARD